MVWTVNEAEHMMEVSSRCLASGPARLTVLVKCVRWEADVILTDVTEKWLGLREALKGTTHNADPYVKLIPTILS